jgi:Leucine-rich repeat (LRR) protein
MNNLDNLRNKFDSQQRDILVPIWRYYLENGRWMPSRLLHVTHGGKKIVRPLLEQLGGSIVYEKDENGILCYGLTFLGILLSSEGKYIEKLLADYLRIARILALKEPTRTHVSSKEALTRLRLGPNGLVDLGRALFLSPFLSSGSYSSTEWNAELPKDIEDLPDDLQTYVCERAAEYYEADIPVSISGRQAYSLREKNSRSLSEEPPAEKRDSYIDQMSLDELNTISSQQYDMNFLFISYARKDEQFAHRLNADLQSYGVQTWIDELGIRAGEDWPDRIALSIEKAGAILVILTPDAVKSKWVKRELSFADQKDKKVLPLLYKPCDLPASFNLQFGRIQRIDFTGGNYQASLRKLLKSIKSFLGEAVEIAQQKQQDRGSSLQIALEKIEEARVNDFSSVAIDGLNLVEVPQTIYTLKDLENFDISRNLLAIIPHEICQLTDLKSLHLDSNRFSEIPRCIFGLKNLTHLYLNDNNFSSLPVEMGNLKKLEMLHLSNNPISTLPEELWQLTNLTHLYLNNIQLVSLSAQISQLRKLTQLYLFDNELQELPEKISELANLKLLGIAGNRITEIPSWIGNLGNLEILIVGTNNSSKVSMSTLPPEIGNLTNLTRLDLVNLHLSELPTEMKKLVNLNQLGLEGNPALNIRKRILRERPKVILDYYFNQVS